MVGFAMVFALTSATALAGPGDLLPHEESAIEPLALLDAPAEGTTCVKAGAICFGAGARDTIGVEAQVASAPKAGVPVVPRFARAASLAARDGSVHDGGARNDSARDGNWTVALASTLKRPALAGNAVFMFFDLDDSEALPNRQFTALYQTSVKAGKTLAVRATLQPSEGFRAGHTYRLRVVQLVAGKELLLAEGDVTLL